jgi:hypothetical protein
MNLWKKLICSLFVILLSSNTLAKNSNTTTITPSPKGWQPALTVDVQKVVTSTASTIMRHFPQKQLQPILLYNKTEGPRTLFKKGKNNETIVWVDIKGKHWAKLAYQFSHEMTHILANHNKKSGKNQWFEESLCEAMSIYTLGKMANAWKHNPPYANWKSDAGSLKKYQTNLLNEKHRYVNIPLSEWLHQNKKKLRDTPYDRAKNEVIGTAIYKLIEAGKFKIDTIQYMNLGKSHHELLSFSDYLKMWLKNAPKANKQSVLNIAELFSISI